MMLASSSKQLKKFSWRTFAIAACFSMIVLLGIVHHVFAQDAMSDSDLPRLEDASALLPANNEPEDMGQEQSQPEIITIDNSAQEPDEDDLIALPSPIENEDIRRDLGPDDFVIPDFLQDQSGLGLGEESSGFTLEKTREELKEEARQKAFEAAIQSLLPLRPEEIRTLLETFDRTQESVEVPVYPAPKPKMIVENISLDPGSPPATIKLAFGHVTTLSLLDITGAKWPVDDISWAGDFEVTETSTEEGSYILRISPRTQYATGNMSMRLLELKTPVIFTMETNRDLVHYRFDAIIPEYGPFATTPLIQNNITVQAGNRTLSTILQGVIPNSAERLNVSGADSRTSAYMIGDTTYVRTPMTLLSPTWNNSVSSADGMSVYTVNNTPVLLLSDNGKMVRARLSERENLLDE